MSINSPIKQLHPKYRPDIDGLRAIAVLAVVVFHAFPSILRGGFIGVDIFFVISGYLISTIIFENLDTGNFSFIDFYTRRIKRIFPALIVVLIFCFIVGWIFLIAEEFAQLGKHMAAGASFISNFVFWNEAGYFDKAADAKPLLHLWSLGIEEQFYMFWPLFLWLAWKYKFNLLTITILIAAASFALNVSGVKSDPVGTFYSPQTRFWELLCGSVLAYIALYKNSVLTSTRNTGDANPIFVKFVQKWLYESKLAPDLISTLGLSGLVYGFWVIDKDVSFPGYWALVPVLSSVIIIAAGPRAFINRTILSSRVMIWLGLISFPLYLWHWPLLSFARIIEGAPPSSNMRLVAVLLAIALAWLTYRLVEIPIRFGKNSKTQVITLIFLMIVIGYLGYNTYSRNGLSFRSADKANINRQSWYMGKNDWLFLGAYDNTTAKLKLSITPSAEEVESTKTSFSAITKKAAEFNTKVVLLVGPDKTSIYPEYLPDVIVPSTKKYSSFFLDQLIGLPNLDVYNPTDDLLRLKGTEGILYWRTDTHWNDKGAFLAYSGLLGRLGLPIPQVGFLQASSRKGDLIGISKLDDFPLHSDDNWSVVWKNKPLWSEKVIPNQQVTGFGPASIVANQNPLVDKRIWVVGDSFTASLRQYFNATFREVRYVGSWGEKFKDLPADLERADKKPDMIIIVRVERSF